MLRREGCRVHWRCGRMRIMVFACSWLLVVGFGVPQNKFDLVGGGKAPGERDWTGRGSDDDLTLLYSRDIHIL